MKYKQLNGLIVIAQSPSFPPKKGKAFHPFTHGAEFYWVPFPPAVGFQTYLKGMVYARYTYDCPLPNNPSDLVNMINRSATTGQFPLLGGEAYNYLCRNTLKVLKEDT